MTARGGPAAAERDEQRAPGDCRCLCGSLLARLRGDAVELKCRRCKRTLLVPLRDARAGRRTLESVRGTG